MAGTLILSSVQFPVTSSGAYAAEVTDGTDNSGLVTETDPTTVELTTDKDGVLTVSKYTGTAGKVDLQALFPDKKILVIANNAFSRNTNITEVVIPPSVITIGKYAFWGCSALKTVTFAGTKEEQKLEYVGDSAFEDTALQNIMLPETVTTLGVGAFADTAIRSIIIPASCTDISAGSTSWNGGAFSECGALEQVIFEERTKELAIGVGTFSECDKLASIQLPKQVTSIPEHAFHGSGLTEITILSGVTSIGRWAFAGNNLLSKVTFKSPDTVVADDGGPTTSNPTFPIPGKGAASDLIFCCDVKSDGSQSNAEAYARSHGIRFVRPAKSLSIEKMPKTELLYGEEINATSLQSDGLVLQAEFDSNIAPTSGAVSINDCLIRGYNPEQIGEQQVTISYGDAKASYPVQVYYDFSKAITDFSSTANYSYTGKPIEPEFGVYIWTKNTKIQLEKDKDYTVSYGEDHTNIGTVTATLTGKGSYKGTITQTFDIVEKKLADNDIKVSVPDVTYNTKQQKPVPVVTYGDVTLKEGVDYNVSYGNNKNAGNEAGSVTITAKSNGNFTGEKTVSFAILPKDISELTFEELRSVVYNGEKQTPSVSISWDGDKELREDTDYEISYKQNVNASENAAVVITGIGNYTGEVEKKFTISPVSMEKVVLTKNAASDYYYEEEDVIDDAHPLTCDYTAAAVIPKIGVYYDGRLLEEGKDYTVAAVNNTEPGMATLTITGMNNFTGSRSINFSIVVNPNKPVPTAQTPTVTAPASTTPGNTGVTPTAVPTVTTKPTVATPEKAKKVSLTSCANKKPKKITTEWKKQDGVSGYEITIATNKKFTSGKKVKTTTATSYTFGKLKKGKTYYIRVRAYVISDKKKIYGTYSAVKKVKVKK